MKHRREPFTAIVFRELCGIEDFLTVAQVAERTKLSVNAVRSALSNLRHYSAVDVVIEPNGVGYWFATPDYDKRTKCAKEIVEDIHRKQPPRKGTFPRNSPIWASLDSKSRRGKRKKA